MRITKNEKLKQVETEKEEKNQNDESLKLKKKRKKDENKYEDTKSKRTRTESTIIKNEGCTQLKERKQKIIFQEENGSVNEFTDRNVEEFEKFHEEKENTIENKNNLNRIKIKNKKDKGSTNKNSKKQNKSTIIVKDGKTYKKLKKGKMKPWFQTELKENKDVKKYNKYYIKHESGQELDQFKNRLEEQGLSEDKIKKIMLKKEKKAFMKVISELKNGDTGKHDENEEERKYVPTVSYEENDLMTNYNGHWILKENANHLSYRENSIYNKIIRSRADGNTDESLTVTEEENFNKAMKKEFRREERLLKLKLIHLSLSKERKNETPKKKRPKKAGKYVCSVDGSKVGLIYYGCPIGKEAFEKLKRKEEKLRKKGKTEEQIKSTMKRKARTEERILKRKTITCSKCHSIGHTDVYCTQVPEENGSISCFRCGQDGHFARQCPKNLENTDSGVVSCFRCGEQGHISRACPESAVTT